MKPLSLVGDDAQESMLLVAATTPPEGCIVEVGVYRGGTAWRLATLARARGVPLYLYDTFTGIPFRNVEKGDRHVVGDFSDVNETEVRLAIPDAIFCKGVFPDTLVEMGPISFVHCDCDQYQSVKDVITYLYPKLLPGGIIVFDDYSCLEGATRAVDEHFVIKEATRNNKALIRAGVTELR